MEKKVDRYGRQLLAQLDEETGGRMFTRYDIEVAQMGFKAGYEEACKRACEEFADYLRFINEKCYNTKAGWHIRTHETLTGFENAIKDE